MKTAKFSDKLVDWLVEEGYTHCFFLAGGNIMHLLDSVRSKMDCVPVIHEAAAGIAVEYFNASQDSKKAFALVTAGPGLTNIVTPIAGAWQESRELLVIGGQVKSTDLSLGKLRQRGIQEISGTKIIESITKKSIVLDSQISKAKFLELVRETKTGRPGPVFIEICLDVQGAEWNLDLGVDTKAIHPSEKFLPSDVLQIAQGLQGSKRPIILIGGGVSHSTIRKVLPELSRLNIPLMTTFNGADRVNDDYKYYFGRPNTWGQRYSNILLQQSDYIIAIGTRLGLQQTGFNWAEFAPLAHLIQVDLDPSEIDKGHPQIDLGIVLDANEFLPKLVSSIDKPIEIESWLEFCHMVKETLPIIEENTCRTEFVSPYVFWNQISKNFSSETIFVPSSSGGTFTTAYQSIALRGSQKLISDKSLASMGYGLSGAIGVAIANPEIEVVLGEGDGGFAQHLQELGTVRAQNLNLKMFIFDNDGYASIRMTQKNYFGGEWIGCDNATQVGMPDWQHLSKAFDIPYVEMSGHNLFSVEVLEKIRLDGPIFIRVICDPTQTYFPKIASRLTPSGTMESNPLHLMDRPLSDEVERIVMKYLERR